MKTIGILGGMGPLATSDLFQKIVALTPAKSDQEHIPIIIDNNTRIPDRTAYILGSGDDPLPELLKSAKRLEAAKVDAIIMPCNTAHYFADTIQSQINIPLIHIVKTAVDVIKTKYPTAKKIAVIATVGTKKADVYGKILLANDYDIVVIDDELQADLMRCIYDGVKAGRTSEYISLFQNCIDRIEAKNIDIMIAACTEIPIFIPHIKSTKPIIDATLELARAAVKFAKS